MSVLFPSVAFFQALQKKVAEDPTTLTELGPCEAYCGFGVGDRLFVLEFDGRECAAVVSGGNLLDLDFVVRGPEQAWKDVLSGAGSLAEQIDTGALEVITEADDGTELARAALPFLQGFFDLTEGLNIDFE